MFLPFHIDTYQKYELFLHANRINFKSGSDMMRLLLYWRKISSIEYNAYKLQFIPSPNLQVLP